MAGETIELTAPVERHDPELPRYAVVPSALVEAWGLEGTTVVEGTIDGAPLGRRSLKQWDKERWFIDLPEALCRRAGVDTGDEVALTLRRASTELPDELEELLSESPSARGTWSGLSASRRRMIREHVLDAKRSATRRRRARKMLGIEGAESGGAKTETP